MSFLFFEQSLFAQQKRECCCGGIKRVAELDIMANVAMKVEDAGLTIKLLVGVRTDDHSHLEYYSYKRESQVYDNMRMVFECHNRLRMYSDDRLSVEPTLLVYANNDSLHQFNIEGFDRRVRAMISQFL